jgi:protein TonB
LHGRQPKPDLQAKTALFAWHANCKVQALNPIGRYAMTTAQALSARPFAEPLPSRKARLRLLKSDTAAKALTPPVAPGGRGPQRAGLEGVLWVLLAAGIHAAIVGAAWNREPQARTLRAPQEIELLRPAPVVPEVKPVEPPPPKRVEPPKAVEPPKNAPPPPAALRTQAAEAPQPNTMTVAENLSAPKSSGPVAAIPTPPPAPPPRVEETVTEPSGYAGYLNNPAPVYPKAAQRLGMQGRVVLRVRVLASGQVGEVEIKQSSGKALLDEAALAAVKGWTFAPAKRGNTAIDAWTQVPIDFKLAQ